MGKTWVLETDTKGTGARLVPLEHADKRPETTEPVLVRRKPKKAPPARTPQPERPPQFRIVDVMTRETILDDADGRAALASLKDVRSIVDVNVYVRRGESDRWSQMAFGELRALWELARAPAEQGPLGRAPAR